MKILVPLIRYVPSGRRSAFVVAEPTSEPACGSVRHIVPPAVPSVSIGTHFFCCSGVPKCITTSATPCVSAGYMLNDVFAPHIISSASACSVNGPPCPPCFSGTERLRQPASNSDFHASLNPGGVITFPFSSLQPCA